MIVESGFRCQYFRVFQFIIHQTHLDVFFGVRGIWTGHKFFSCWTLRFQIYGRVWNADGNKT